MDIKLGAIPLDANILKLSDIGLWAFELDEGLPPRMYVDDAMLSLLGLKKQVSPEETYHAWYDNIDPLHYEEVKVAVEKMGEGLHSEVQYPWHHPNGKIMIVRCGGTRNYAYTKGIRIEGLHRDVTKLVHFEKERELELRRKTLQLQHEQLRTDALNYLAENEPDAPAFINYFAGRLLTITGCDQVIYRSINGEKIQKNAPGIENVSDHYCEKCPYSNPLNIVYEKEIVELEDIHHSVMKNNPKCPVKSSYNNVVKLNGKVEGMLAIHYIQTQHQITPPERETLNQFSQMLSLALANIEARKNREIAQRELLDSASNIINSFCNDYTTVYSVNTQDNTFKIIKAKDPELEKTGVLQKDFNKYLKKYVQKEVAPKDRKRLLEQLEYTNVIKKLEEEGTYTIEYRAEQEGVMVWHEMSISTIIGAEILIGTGARDIQILLKHVDQTIQDEYYGIYVAELEKDLVRAVKNSKNYVRKIKVECYSKAFLEFTRGLDKRASDFLTKLANPDYVQYLLLKDNKLEYVYYSPHAKSWTKITTLVLERNEKNVPLTIAHCFSNVDVLQRQNQELSLNLQKQVEENEQYESQIEESLTFTNFFLNTFNSAIYVNLDDRTSKIYKRSIDERQNSLIEADYYSALCDHARRSAIPADRELLCQVFSPAFIKEVLRKETEYSCVFTDTGEPQVRRIRYQVIRGADPRHAAIGFVDITADIEAEHKYTNTMMSLSDNFQAIYDVDFTTSHYVIYSENNAYADQVTRKMNNKNDFFEDIAINIQKLIYKDDREMISKLFEKDTIRKIIKQDREVNVEYRLVISNQPQWYKLKIRKSTQDKNHFLIGVFNVNEERAKEKEIHEVVDGLASEFNSLFHVDAVNGTFKIYMLAEKYNMNKVAAATNFQYEKLIKWISENNTHPDEKEKYLHATDIKQLKKTLAHQKAIHTFFRRRCGKEYHWFELVIVKVQDIDEPMEDFIMYYTDRDQQVRDEQENKHQLQEALGMAQSANRAKTIFLNNMSHDIRTPMNAIIGYTDLATAHIDNKDQVSDYLKKISQSSDHLLNLINDVLDMSRIESGKMKIVEKHENLREIVKGVRDIIKAEADVHQLNLITEQTEVQDSEIICDKLRLKQVLLNVLSNAVKYTKPGGNVTIHVKQLGETANGYGTYEFYVKDSGIGMTKKFLETIFDPFTRMQNSTVSGIQGTGLGMSITKNLVDMMGGEIKITSEPNKGTTVIVIFSFKLQKKNSKTAEKQKSIPEPKKQQPVSKKNTLEGAKILLVEDNEFNREIAIELLNDFNIKVFTACDGVEAVEKMKVAKPGDYDLILMDIQMPVMNGYEATRQIRAMNNEVSKIPILAMTANAFEEDRKMALDAGMNEHITKPIDISFLIKTLEKFI